MHTMLTFVNPIDEFTASLRSSQVDSLVEVKLNDVFECLDFCNNNLTTLEISSKLRRVVTVLASENKIRTISTNFVTKLPKLAKLSLNMNSIASFEEITKLSNSHITNLCLLNNPICQHPNYRTIIVKILPHLEVLDFEKVTRSERNADIAIPSDSVVPDYSTESKSTDREATNGKQTTAELKKRLLEAKSLKEMKEIEALLNKS